MSINLHLGDCLEAMRAMPDNSYELAIVDPPYGINVANNTTGTVIRNKSDKDIFKIKDWDKDIPSEDYFIQLKRVSKNQVIWGGNYFLDFLGYCKAPIIWDKKNGESPYADGEFAWTSKGLPKNLKIFRHQWCGAFKDSERGAKKYHPTQKPIRLYEWILDKYAKEGDKILDTHLGSGSIALACHNRGFDLTAFEIDEEYYNAAKERLRVHQIQLTIF